MDGLTSTVEHDGRTVELKEMGNGCYIEIDGSQYLLKPETVFRNLSTLPVDRETKERLGIVIDTAISWVENANREWDTSTEYDGKLLEYILNNWQNDDSGLMAHVAEQLAESGVMLCNRSGKLFTLGEWGRPTGSYVATVADDEASRCPECGAPKSEYWECIRSSRRTRVPDKYKCQNCGTTRNGITTG